jgi:hypothetical protein
MARLRLPRFASRTIGGALVARSPGRSSARLPPRASPGEPVTSGGFSLTGAAGATPPPAGLRLATPGAGVPDAGRAHRGEPADRRGLGGAGRGRAGAVGDERRAAVFVGAAVAASASWQALLAGGGALIGRLVVSRTGALAIALASSLLMGLLAARIVT